ncbi:MAG: CDP-diacylglycerol--glycerol-3-phosphate 3-phosphatidyltransferase [Deltaproteobacteria bacterium]|nr:CDP-diacylglycerol--glycerol-3-phosphate 3-phosphatidyltransferase [Deltaproteobacteria bacterium]MCX7952789.1 CDP-diacylglycerol--glycerol-3-phosphate 3-phosphatidyltransferase [Deltaproteobacteria bacterium]
MNLQKLPNYLSYSRIVITFAILVLLTEPTFLSRIVAFTLFLLAAASDFLDGFIARRYNLVSEEGKLIDPLTDKILVVSVLIMLVELKRTESGVLTDQSYLPAWLVALFVIREIWVLGLRSVHALRNKALQASQTAKWKTLLQMLAISFLILGNIPLWKISGYIVTTYIVGYYILIVSLIFSIISAVAYTVEVFKEYNS